MPTYQELVISLVADALSPIHARLLYPEKQRKRFPEKQDRPLKPRERITARLTLMLALTEYKVVLSRELLADREAIADSKAHKQEAEAIKIALGLLPDGR